MESGVGVDVGMIVGVGSEVGVGVGVGVNVGDGVGVGGVNPFSFFSMASSALS